MKERCRKKGILKIHSKHMIKGGYVTMPPFTHPEPLKACPKFKIPLQCILIAIDIANAK